MIRGSEDRLDTLSQLSGASVPGRIQTGLTAVRREHRGHSLAWTLMHLALEAAASRGPLTVRISDDQRNRPALHVTVALDVAPLPARLTVRCAPGWDSAETPEV